MFSLVQMSCSIFKCKVVELVITDIFWKWFWKEMIYDHTSDFNETKLLKLNEP